MSPFFPGILPSLLLIVRLAFLIISLLFVVTTTESRKHNMLLAHNHLDSSHFATSFSTLRDLRAEDVLTDISLVANDKCTRAHKLVLMAASDYFRTMFKSCFCESGLEILELPGM